MAPFALTTSACVSTHARARNNRRLYSPKYSVRYFIFHEVFIYPLPYLYIPRDIYYISRGFCIFPAVFIYPRGIYIFPAVFIYSPRDLYIPRGIYISLAVFRYSVRYLYIPRGIYIFPAVFILSLAVFIYSTRYL